MSITILGGGGFLGAKLARRLARDGQVGGRPVEALTLFDLQPPPVPDHAPFPVRSLGGDVSDPASVGAAIPPGTRVVVHLAAVVSAQAEADFDLGLRVNLHGTLGGAGRLPRPAGTAAGGVHLLRRLLRRRAGLGAARRRAAEPGQQLRRAEGHGRIAAGRRDPARHGGRGEHPPAHRHHPPRPPQPRRLLLRVGDPARAAARPRDGAPGGRGLRGLDLLAPPRGGVAAARHGHGHGPDGRRPRRQPAGHARQGGRHAGGAGAGGGPGSARAGAAGAGPGGGCHRRRLARRLHRRARPRPGSASPSRSRWTSWSGPLSRTTWRKRGGIAACRARQPTRRGDVAMLQAGVPAYRGASGRRSPENEKEGGNDLETARRGCLGPGCRRLRHGRT